MLPKRDAPPNPRLHPDAALISLWDAYTAALTAYEVTPEPACDRYGDIAEALGGEIERPPVRTMAGMGIQARYLFVTHVGSKDSWDAAVFDNDPSERLTAEMKRDSIARTLWAMVQNAKKAGGAQ